MKRQLKNIMVGFLLVLPLNLWAQMRGDGGSCVEKDGRCMTFYSAKIMIKGAADPFAVEEGLFNIAGLNEVIRFLSESHYIPNNFKQEIIEDLMPSKRRHYYDIDSAWFTAENRNRILYQFEKATGMPASQMKLFAVTDTETKTTFLFPEFYQLNPIEQQTALFHEAYWLYGSRSYQRVFTSDLQKNYELIISIETAFQAMLTYPKNLDGVIKFLAVVNQLKSAIKLALIEDYRSGVINAKGELSNGVTMLPLSTENLVGLPFKNSQKIGAGDCGAHLLGQLSQLKKEFPGSYFVKALFAYCYATDCSGPDFVYIGPDALGLYRGHGDSLEPVIVPLLGINKELTEGETIEELRFGFFRSRLFKTDYMIEVILN